MQKIIHTDKTYKNIHPIMDELERMYSVTADKDYVQDSLIPLIFDESLEQIQTLFNNYGYTDYDFQFIDKKFTKLSLDSYNPKNIIVCHSGGKDSTSVVKHYMMMGYNVYLYHVTGLNKTYYDEWKCVEEVAKYLQLPYKFDDVSYKGFCNSWYEHPMKNMILANMALTYGIKEGIGTKIAFGNFYTSTLETDDFAICGGDSVEMWKAYENAIKKIIPKFHIYRPNKNYQTACNALREDKELLSKTISCMTPNRFREHFRKRTLKNYKVDLLPNRCGCCWKCAVEYIWFADHNVFEYNEEYYLHCVDVIRRNAEKSSIFYTNVFELWSDYFFYPIEKSKCKTLHTNYDFV